MKTYLEPLKKETFLSNTEINALFGNIQEIYGFQQQFLQTLENALETEAQFYNLDSPSQFKVKYSSNFQMLLPASQCEGEKEMSRIGHFTQASLK